MGASAHIERYPIEHFDIYQGEYFELAVKTQIAFLKKHLEPDSPETH